MKGFTIKTQSFTQAEKARSFLARRGIKSIVQRTTGRGGCLFLLKITNQNGASMEEICRLLSQIGVSCDLS